jgi:glycosyltransferase involved in cell wall biosynthesis
VQQAAFGTYYAKAGAGARARLRDALDTWCLKRAALHTPWSAWAARSLREDHGIPPERIRVLPPGIDLDRWPYLQRPAAGDRLRLLFVGGDFERKGGKLLLDAFRRALQHRCELHIVTREAVPHEPNVFVYHGLEPNDARLRELYRRCELFVLPTNADCFSLASMEAMASGLPVVSTTVGGIPEIVAEGRSGFLIAPGDGQALVERIRLLLDAPERRMTMGACGRRIVEERFDAAHNTAVLLGWMQELLEDRRRSRERTMSEQQWPAGPRAIDKKRAPEDTAYGAAGERTVKPHS